MKKMLELLTNVLKTEYEKTDRKLVKVERVFALGYGWEDDSEKRMTQEFEAWAKKSSERNRAG